MGLIGRIKNWLTLSSSDRKRLELEEKLHLQNVEFELEVLEREMKRFKEAEYDTSLPAAWNFSGAGGSLVDDDLVDEEDFYELLQNSKKLEIGNQCYHACIETYKKFVYGKGPTIRAKMPEAAAGEELSKEEKAREDKANAYWNAFWFANNLSHKDKEISRRKNRDGDCFMCFEGQDGNSIASKEVDIDGEKFVVPEFRFLSALRVKDWEGVVPFGIELENDDPETPKVYKYSNSDGTDGRDIKAEFVIQWKCNADSDWRRGLPILTSCMHWFTELNRFCQNAVDRTSIQNAHVLIRTVKNGTAASDVHSQNLKDNNNTNETVQRRVKGGTVITHGAGMDYKFVGPNMEGSRPEDARLILLLIASGAGLAEYMVSADASNANYASTMVSESPAVRTFEDQQDEDTAYWQKVWTLVRDFGIANGELDANAPTMCIIDWQPLIARNVKDEAMALDILSAHGLSDPTILTKSGFNHKDEFARSRAQMEFKMATSMDMLADKEEKDSKEKLSKEVAEAVNECREHCSPSCDHETA